MYLIKTSCNACNIYFFIDNSQISTFFKYFLILEDIYI